MMVDSVLPNHPHCKLRAIWQGELTSAFAQSFEQTLIEWSCKESWVIEAPELVDYIDEYAERESHVYGCILEIYSAFPPWDKRLPRSIDERHFHEVSKLITELTELTRRFEGEFQLQLDETIMGSIRHGEMSNSLRDGLLGEWKKVLGLT